MLEALKGKKAHESVLHGVFTHTNGRSADGLFRQLVHS